ncbi:MAG: hypothetical protein OXG15_02370, partial [Gammaproteobacteria bacterium]|nr:hypothetical protein [Gammaproteobacteria bacterium]
MLPGIKHRDFYALQSGYVRLLPIDYEVLVDPADWAAGRPVIPEVALPRVRQLELFSMLYDGDYREFLENCSVTMNFHRLTAVFLADTLMAVPPTITYEGEQIAGEEGRESVLTVRFLESLLQALHHVIVDMARYGTGIFRIEDVALPTVTAPQPIAFYPLIDGGAAFVSRGLANWEVVQDYGETIEYDFYNTDESGLLGAGR